MAKVVKQPMVSVLKEYYVFDPSIKKLATVPVVTRGDNRVVLMTEQQAQFFIDQGAIGDKPLSELSETHRDVIHQISKGRIHRDNDQLPERADVKKNMPRGPQGRSEPQENKAALRGAARAGFSPPPNEAVRKEREK